MKKKLYEYGKFEAGVWDAVGIVDQDKNTLFDDSEVKQ